MNIELITAVCLGLGLSASCGFRVFIPLLVAAVAGKLGYLPLSQNFQWLAGWPAIICFASAGIFELLAYYIPFIDNLLDTLTTPLAVAAGTVLATSVLPVDNELLKWVTGIILGGGSAATIQTGTSVLRLASTKTTAGIGNKYIATGEHAAALGGSVLSLVIPIVIGAIVILLIIYILVKLGGRMFATKGSGS
ncbi:MAG: DUF4126 domain-containing protein [Chitinophagaceae bacterium]|nr:DUF4126 domain-containing protein [Chitinophagaceae bacterium]